MKAVLQRADGASVSVEGRVVGGFTGEGLVALIGVGVDDEKADAVKIARKIAELRILEGERSLVEAAAPVLIISQFTLYGDTHKGRRPSWSGAARAEVAEPLVELVVQELKARDLSVSTGVFGAQMEVAFTNSGPFTVLVES